MWTASREGNPIPDLFPHGRRGGRSVRPTRTWPRFVAARETILVVEDDDQLRRSVKRILERPGTRSSRPRMASRRSRRCARRRACGSCSRSRHAATGGRALYDAARREGPHHTVPVCQRLLGPRPRRESGPVGSPAAQAVDGAGFARENQRDLDRPALPDLPRERVRHETASVGTPRRRSGLPGGPSRRRYNRRVEHLHAGPLGAAARRARAAHAGHHDIGHEGYRSRRVAAESTSADGPSAASSTGSRGPRGCAGERAHRRRVLDEQDRLVAAAHLLRLGRGRRSLGDAGHAGEVDLDVVP